MLQDQTHAGSSWVRGQDTQTNAAADIFRISHDDARKLCIEPPFNVDYGYNIIFEGIVSCRLLLYLPIIVLRKLWIHRELF